MNLSVVIPSLNGERYLAEQLEALKNQLWGGSWEVVLADNGSTDASRDIARRYQARVLNAGARKGSSYARNFGAEAAKGDMLLFLDQDDVVAPGYIRAMASALDDSPFVCARMDFERLNPRWVVIAREGAPGQQERLIDEFDYLPHAAGSTLGIHRWLFEEIGGFDESFRAYEDVDFCWRIQLAGFPPPVIVPAAVLHYRLRSDFLGLFRQASFYGQGHTLIRRQYGLPPHRVHLLGELRRGACRWPRANLGLLLWKLGLLYGLRRVQKDLPRQRAAWPKRMLPKVRWHLVAHRWVWLLLAVLAVVANEVVDRTVWHERHTDGDILAAIGVVAIAFVSSYVVVRRKQRREAP